jgi:hypothetical protein
MNRSQTLIFAAAVSLALAPSASAQPSMTSQTGFESLGAESSISSSPSLPSTANGGGVKVSETSVLHVGVGAAAGYDSNVFYSDQNRISSPIFDVTPYLDLTNESRTGTKTDIVYNLGASLQYREYLSDDESVKAQRAFNPAAGAGLLINANQSFRFGISDQFTRLQEPPYLPSTGNITRDYNLASASIGIAPGGGRIGITLRYTNSLEIFENDDLKYANVMGHEGLLDVSWRWLPKTAIYAQVAQGVIVYLNDDPQNRRFGSYPLRAIAGLRGLVTSKLTVNLGVGYAAGFYQDNAPNPSGLSNVAAVIEFFYAPTMLTRITLGYRHEFRNSPVVGTFYDVDTPYFGLRQLVASRLQIGLYGRYEPRRYRGVLVNGALRDRKDNMVTAGAMLDYFIQQWFYAGVTYSLAFNDSDLDLPNTTGLDYTKHQVLGRLGVVY